MALEQVEQKDFTIYLGVGHELKVSSKRYPSEALHKRVAGLQLVLPDHANAGTISIFKQAKS
jgi:hypothetical protein